MTDVRTDGRTDGRTLIIEKLRFKKNKNPMKVSQDKQVFKSNKNELLNTPIKSKLH